MRDRWSCSGEGARRVLALGVAVGVLVVGLVASLLAPSAPATLAAPLPVPPPNTDPVPERAQRPLVLLGTAGLRWSDVSQTNTPTLAALSQTWGVANMAVRTVRPTTCPADGWLTVSAGNRTGDLPHRDGCRDLGGVRAGRVDFWDQYLRGSHDGTVPGQLGQALAAAEIPVAGIGPGAAVALARTDGTAPERWVPRPEDPEDLTQAVVEALKGGTRVVVVDLGVVHDDASATQVDAALHAALAGAGDANVLVASVADRPGGGPDLQLVARGQVDVSAPGLLTSASTRQNGVVAGTDMTATLLSWVGMGGDLRPSWVAGMPLRQRAPGDGVDGLVDAAEHATVVRPLVSRFSLGLVVVNIVLCAAAWLAVARAAGRVPSRRRAAKARHLVLRWLTMAGLAAAAVPASLLLANLVPWWRAAIPSLALALTAGVVATGIVGLALAGPWRRSALGPAGLVAAVTVGVVVVDLFTGPRLAQSAVFGTLTLAGQFFGLANTTFALATTGTLLLVSVLVVPLVRAGRRTWAAVVALAAAVALTVVDGSPTLGDFGGTPALVPAFAMLVAVLLVGPVRRRTVAPRLRAWLPSGAPFAGLADAAPTLGPFFVATATALLVGFVGNGSAIAIPAAGAAVVVPLVVAVCAGWLARVPAKPVLDEPDRGEPAGSAEPDRSDRRTAALATAAAGVVALVVTFMLWSGGALTPQVVQAAGHHLVRLVVVVVVAVLVLVLGAVAVITWGIRGRGGRVVPPQLRKTTVATLLLVGCAPAGAFLAGLSRWWATTVPTVFAPMWWAVATVAVALAAWLTSRASTPGPGRLTTWTAALTWLALSVDQLAGAPLAPGSVLGNLAGVHVLAGLALAAALGTHLRRPGGVAGTLTAAGAVVLVGVVTVVVVGWPPGGQVVLAAAFAVLVAGTVGGLARLPHRWGSQAVLLAASLVALLAVASSGGQGRVTAVVVAVLAGAALVAASALDHAWGSLPDDPLAVAAPARTIPAVIVATGGGLVALVLLAQVFVPLVPRPAGAVTAGRGASAVSPDRPVVVVGVSGVAWDALSPTGTPTLWRLLDDGAPAAAVVPGVTGPSRQCPAEGWLALSSGRNALTGTTSPGVPFSCLPVETVARPDGSAVIVGFQQLADLQTTSEYRPRLGALGQALATSTGCATAVGPRAGLALATPDGSVPRYRPLEAALDDGTDAFDCPITLVDAGSAAPTPTTADQTVDTAAASVQVDEVDSLDASRQMDQAADTADALQRVDQTVGQLIAVVPDDVTVLVVDTGPDALGPGRLGVAFGDVSDGRRYLTSAATRWSGVFRLHDVPLTLLDHAGVPASDDFSGAPLVVGAQRPADPTTTVSELAELSTRDQALRGTSMEVTKVPLYTALVVLLLAAVGGPLLARYASAWLPRARRVADVVLLVMAAMPVGVFAMTATWWWQVTTPSWSMWGALVAATVAAAGCVALVPRRRLTTGPGLLAGIAFVLLTVDALAGTPLHRGSPLGPAVAGGGRFYGFGNPTYSLYVVAALVTATVVGGALVRRGRRVSGVLAASAVCATAFVVDLWPDLGADLGGGLVLAPAGVVVVLGVAGARLTWRRLAVAGVLSVALVGAIGVLDWLRPPGARTHLGAFVQRVIDGSAAEIVWRKLGYAVATVTNGSLVWLTFALLVFTAVVLWLPWGWRCAPWDRLSQAWPLARTTVVALLVAGVGGALTNDYGVRIVTLMFTAGVPLLGLAVLRSADDHLGTPAWWAPASTAGRWAANQWATVRHRWQVRRRPTSGTTEDPAPLQS
ncbi:MAG: hypothetical protein FWF21_08320 [Micrococcales bacterium]|nr:hypothetical protein [Micrococcales bacterium]